MNKSRNRGVARMAVLSLVAAALVIVAAEWVSMWFSPLDVSAPTTTLRMGQTVQLSVAKKTWFGREPLRHPEDTTYMTTWESMAVVERDGKVTAVGTWGESRENTDVTAFNGALKGMVAFTVINEGHGPTLDFVIDAPVTELPAATCCAPPVKIIEGTPVKFRLERRGANREDITRRRSGTRYTLFFGSGVPDDPHAADIVGYGQDINPTTFKIDDENGMIVPPVSIGHLNYFTVLVFARNGQNVGWKQIRVSHASGVARD